MKSQLIHTLYSNPEKSAAYAGLKYADQTTVGFTREKHGKQFVYKDVSGKLIKDQNVIERIQKLGIPPAWKDVWISKFANTHLQATGSDGKGIKQYKYHKKWSELREAIKFYRLVAFAEDLPNLRKAIQDGLKAETNSKEKVVCTVLALMDELSIRIGNETYAEANKTYGLTTLQDRHVEVKKDEITIHFVGKSHKEHEFHLKDHVLAQAVQESKAIPGSDLFQYMDEHNIRHDLTSSDVNEFIQKTMEQDFTAKDFRTWAATSHAYSLMKDDCMKVEKPNIKSGNIQQKNYKKSLKQVITCVAEKLGNTAAVCKAHYIHKDLQTDFENGTFPATMKKLQHIKKSHYVSADELQLQMFLEKMYVKNFRQP